MKLRAILLIVILYIIYGYVEACQGFRSMDQMPMTMSKIHKERRTFGMPYSFSDITFAFICPDDFQFIHCKLLQG